ncbi:hypothetical protein AALO_G00263820 [Alosa alosa]|uniref:L27-1 domain-containing protein n=1 Tax=Alosa alosa TaxID=278164 RepID=A0AAV6FKC0_9TELE|nr:hypothetical protein AALO_G00263820 [Alosa alosa]
MVHKYDTDRAVGLLSEYQANLTRPEEQTLKNNVGKVSAIFGSQLFQALLDIQECYEVTLQLNATENGPKENGAEEAEENSTEEEEEEGVSRVRVTSRRSPQKVERVCGLVSRSHIDTPKSSCTYLMCSHEKPDQPLPLAASVHSLDPFILSQ